MLQKEYKKYTPTDTHAYSNAHKQVRNPAGV